MRRAFVDALLDIAKEDERVVVITPDMGFSVFERFREAFPERIYNTGIAEQNSVGIASGLALNGKVVFVYSIVPFVTMRPFEQVRIDACYQNLPIKLVGSGGGLTYGPLGPTHHSIEDIALMRALPNMSVLCPGDPIESVLCTKEAHRIPGPAYIRLGKGSGEPTIHESTPDFSIGRGIVLKEGKDANIISTGNMLENATLASGLLEKEGIGCGVVSMPSVKPLDLELVSSLSRKAPLFSLEEHSMIGGLGSAVAEFLSESGEHSSFLRIALPDRFCHEVGSQQYLRNLYGLSPEGIAKRVISRIK
ncbi:1-deoxy-D-xylulose-5-phosphate synthase [Candidatus Micrarchaeota archaeon]|nr:1-deoxy-D-xylulose-5-phosphate synthase [Candidatus Micrarchaeota archaeon]